MLQIWSYGGGKQSAAIAALIIRGDLPRPDAIVMSDTERERSSTYRYLDEVINPALAAIDLSVTVIRKSEYATVDLYSKNGDVLIPAYSTLTKEVTKLPTYCSNEWKRRVVMRWMAANGYRPAEMWLGISTDEAHRMKDSDTGWLTHRYPLIDLLMSREDCKRIVAEMGWPEAPKSTCWMCPHLSDDTWREMRRDDPQDFEKAIHLERGIHERDNQIFLHRSGKPLDAVEFDGTLPGLYDGCDSGMCWT